MAEGAVTAKAQPKNRVKEPCGAWMPKAKEPCARNKGHAPCHRTRYALDNNRDSYWFGLR